MKNRSLSFLLLSPLVLSCSSLMSQSQFSSQYQATTLAILANDSVLKNALRCNCYDGIVRIDLSDETIPNALDAATMPGLDYLKSSLTMLDLSKVELKVDSLHILNCSAHVILNALDSNVTEGYYYWTCSIVGGNFGDCADRPVMPDFGIGFVKPFGVDVIYIDYVKL